ncbi:MAG: peptide chain release factor N(5)-glutamine methyltransferase [Polyangiaceae bacterium]|nr:peptide chain release factor N(5)-glutamine methyltransferase [Polyangiaceae bacterium]
MSRPALWSIRRAVSWATEDFRARGFPSPRLDAELLLGHAIGLDRVHVVIEGERPLDASELSRFRELIQRRRTAEPVAYILGQREFFGLAITVDRRVLIPRPDTEILVQTALKRTERRDAFGRALDLCTGSGCVALAFACQRHSWQLTAIDISADAVELGRENAERLGLASTIRFLVGDLYEPLGQGERFDLITANPPYIPAFEVDRLESGIRDFEPSIALDGGPDGLRVTRRIIESAPKLLEPGGVLALEIGYDQGSRVEQLMQAAGLGRIERARDYGKHERVVSGVLE